MIFESRRNSRFLYDRLLLTEDLIELFVLFSNFFSPLYRQTDTALAHSESGYTTAPCNNALLHPVGAVNGIQPANGVGDVTKNSNLLVNVPTKDDVGVKNNITNVSTTAVLNASTTSTIGRNGTLCKKVYL